MRETGKNPREAALLILEQIFLKGAYANLALAQGLRRAPLSPLDKKLTTELVYGTVKTMGTLDWYLSRVVNRPLRKLDPLVLVILRLGAAGGLSTAVSGPDPGLCRLQRKRGTGEEMGP